MSIEKKIRTDPVSPVSIDDVMNGKVMKYTICTLKASGAMPASLQITHGENLRLETGPTSLLVLCDTSGSMGNGRRLDNLRDGVKHICTFMRRSANAMDITIISFSDNAKILYGPGPVPDEETVDGICARDLQATNGTNIGGALEKALAAAVEDKPAHVLLLTDGADSYQLADHFELIPPGHILDKISKRNFLTLHCVGICTDADAKTLSRLADIAYAGTFQIIKDRDISSLMGSLFALMSEMLGVNGFVTVSVDGAEALSSTKFPLRVCSPPVTIRLPFNVADGAKEIVVEVDVGDFKEMVRLALPRDDPDHVDPECAIDAIADLRSKAAAKVAESLQTRDYDGAKALNDTLVAQIQAIGAIVEDPGVADMVNEAVVDLTEQANAIEAARTNANTARDLEIRNLSRAATERCTSLSINPNGGARTMSDYQHELSLMY